MTLKLLAIEKLKSIRDHLMTAGYPTHMIVSEIDAAIDSVQDYKEKPAEKE